MRKNHRSALPEDLLFFDTETSHTIVDNEQFHVMDIAWSSYTRRDKEFNLKSEEWLFWRDSHQLCEYIASKAYDDRVLWVFAHNAFFDLQVSAFFRIFPRDGWELDFIYDKALSFALVIRREKQTIKVVSTTNYFPVSLAQLGAMVGLSKLDVDFAESSPEDIKRYCRRDVEITRLSVELFARFIQKYDLGTFSLTRASQAMRAFRHRFMSVPIYCHREGDIAELERSAYYGGRTECFSFGEQKGGPFVSLDVNSMYPYVMRNFECPARLIDYHENVDIATVARHKDSYCYVAEIRVDTTLPYLAKRLNKKVIFPVGRFKTFVGTEGLLRAMEANDICAIDKLAVYEKEFVFRDYVDFFYEHKVGFLNGDDPVQANMCKLFLNCLYGKFGQKRPITETEQASGIANYSRYEWFDVVTGERGIVYELFNKLVSVYGEEEAPNSFVAIAAHITEYSRFHLWRLISLLGLDKVIYCDTDSIKCRASDAEFLSDWIDDDRLGYLKIEHTDSRLRIDGLKSYQTQSERKLKGVPKTAKEISPYTFVYPQFHGMPTHMRRGVCDRFVISSVTKEAPPFYDKGTINSNGTISPLVLSEF